MTQQCDRLSIGYFLLFAPLAFCYCSCCHLFCKSKVDFSAPFSFSIFTIFLFRSRCLFCLPRESHIMCPQIFRQSNLGALPDFFHISMWSVCKILQPYSELVVLFQKFSKTKSQVLCCCLNKRPEKNQQPDLAKQRRHQFRALH